MRVEGGVTAGRCHHTKCSERSRGDRSLRISAWLRRRGMGEVAAAAGIAGTGAFQRDGGHSANVGVLGNQGGSSAGAGGWRPPPPGGGSGSPSPSGSTRSSGSWSPTAAYNLPPGLVGKGYTVQSSLPQLSAVSRSAPNTPLETSRAASPTTSSSLQSSSSSSDGGTSAHSAPVAMQVR